MMSYDSNLLLHDLIFVYANHYTIENVAYTCSCCFKVSCIFSTSVELVNPLPTVQFCIILLSADFLSLTFWKHYFRNTIKM